MNGRDHICIDFDSVNGESFGELRFTLPESSVVSGVLVDAQESTYSEIYTIDVQV